MCWLVQRKKDWTLRWHYLILLGSVAKTLQSYLPHTSKPGGLLQPGFKWCWVYAQAFNVFSRLPMGVGIWEYWGICIVAVTKSHPFSSSVFVFSVFSFCSWCYNSYQRSDSIWICQKRETVVDDNMCIQFSMYDSNEGNFQVVFGFKVLRYCFWNLPSPLTVSFPYIYRMSYLLFGWVIECGQLIWICWSLEL